jgi:hypothetical protein
LGERREEDGSEDGGGRSGLPSHLYTVDERGDLHFPIIEMCVMKTECFEINHLYIKEG